MKETFKGIKNVYNAFYMIQKDKPGHPLVNKYKAGRDAARLIWYADIRPRVDAFFNEGKKK